MDFHLDNFDGPLDLLLHLISKNKVSIYDIPIAEIPEQYMAVLHEAEHMDLDVAPVTLSQWQRSWCTSSPSAAAERHEEDEAEEDRAGLVEMLLEYQETQERDCVLRRKNETGRDIYVKPPERQDDARRWVSPHGKRSHPRGKQNAAPFQAETAAAGDLVFRALSGGNLTSRGRVTAIRKRFLYRMAMPFMRLFDDAKTARRLWLPFWHNGIIQDPRIRFEGTARDGG